MRHFLFFVVVCLFVGEQGLWADVPHDDTPPVCPDVSEAYARIPEGEFLAGSSVLARDIAAQESFQGVLRDQEGRFSHERDFGPQDTGFFEIAHHLVTQKEYSRFVKSTGHRAPFITETAWIQQGFLVHPYSVVEMYLWRGSRNPRSLNDHPVVLVSREDALAYADWLGLKTGCRYRLPTSLEWERAARGEDGRSYPWGTFWEPKKSNSGGREGGTTEVGSFSLGESPYGLLNMAGNVFEWTADDYQRHSSVSEETTPIEGVLKGCSWDDLPGYCRAAYWHARLPSSRHILIGFRLVRELPSLSTATPEPTE
ncbi:SUMF1/EgtB/PvdO family nonheme iron enzyme [bacterium]|nr:SUMF1/EgtB/PvdO family nonheme iron enzyme [bacterium]